MKMTTTTYTAEEWQAFAECAAPSVNNDVFFSEEIHGIAAAKQICSDCPVIWFMAFMRMVKAESYSVALEHPRASPFLGCRHLFSCEIKPDKRLWLTKNIMPQLLFEDICSLGQDEAWDILSGALVRVPHADAVPAECMRGMKWFEVHLNCSCSSRAAVAIAQYRSCSNCLTLVERGGAWMCGVSV